MSDSLSVKELSNQHKKRVRTIRDANEIEVAKIQLAHQKRVNELKNQNEIQLINIKGQFENKRGQELQRNEKVLEKLKQNVEDTKKVTSREIDNLTNNYDKRRAEIRQNFEENFDNIKQTNTMKMQDLNESAKMDLKKLQRKVDFEKQQIESQGMSEKRIAKAKYTNQVQSDKNEYFSKSVAQQDKFQRALLSQRKIQTDKIAFEDKKNKKIIQNKEREHQKMMDKLVRDSVNKRDIKKNDFETQYKKMFKDNESLLQRLLSKKEKIMDSLKREVLGEYKLSLQRSDDPFYDFSKLDPIIEEGERGYKISIPVPEQDAKNVSLKGEDRKLTLTFERKTNLTDQEDDGTKNKVNKVESYVTQVPVNYIVNPSTLQKSFEDGMVVFKIAYK